MVLAPIVALGAACDGPGGRGFALGIGTVAFFVTPGWRSPMGLFFDDFLAGSLELSAEDSEVLHGLMAISTVDVNRDRLEFLG